jgi:hypothetical protein
MSRERTARHIKETHDTHHTHTGCVSFPIYVCCRFNGKTESFREIYLSTKNDVVEKDSLEIGREQRLHEFTLVFVGVAISLTPL